MRRLVYQVKVGETPGFYDVCIASVAEYCERHGLDHVVQTDPILRILPAASQRSANALRLGYLPIYEKAAALGYLDRYEQVAILDADVYARPGAPCIFDELTTTFAAVPERDMPLNSTYRDKVRKYSEGQYRTLDDVEWNWTRDGADFCNMGVMLFGDLRPYLDGQTPGEFLRRPEFARFVNGEGHWRWSTDQTLLNWWIRKAGIPRQALDWRWNALYGAVTDVHEAYFIHFFLAAKMARGGEEIPELIRRL